MKTMPTVTEIARALVPALRLSTVLPNDRADACGCLHLLLDAEGKAVGYYVEKVSLEDAWESQDPRCFITPSLKEAMQLVAIPFVELPEREEATAA